MLAEGAVLLAAAGGHFVNLPFASLQGAALAAPPISSDVAAISARDFMAFSYGRLGRVTLTLAPEKRRRTASWLAWLLFFAHIGEVDGVTSMGASESTPSRGPEMKKIVTLALAFLMAGNAQAACQWKFDCTGGQCRQIPLCDSANSVVPIRPLQIAPIAPPSIAPLGRPTVPPIGTRSCSPRQICNSAGQCSWQTVCQ